MDPQLACAAVYIIIPFTSVYMYLRTSYILCIIVYKRSLMRAIESDGAYRGTAPVIIYAWINA